MIYDNLVNLEVLFTSPYISCSKHTTIITSSINSSSLMMDVMYDGALLRPQQASYSGFIINHNKSNMISLLLCWVSLVLLMLTISAAEQVPHMEMTALSALHKSTGGDTWRWQDERVAGAVWNFTLDSAGQFADNPCSRQLSNCKPDVARSKMLSNPSCVFFAGLSHHRHQFKIVWVIGPHS